MSLMDIKFPIGLSNFERIKTEGFYYIDKTKYITILEKYNFPVLLRPRRFGKTLFADTLREYYDINKKDFFDKLFADTYISNHKTAKANSYYVLYLNFSGLDTRNSQKLEKSFLARIKSAVIRFLQYYDLKVDFEDTDEIESFVSNFLVMLESTITEKLYIIIDEYDHFANGMLDAKDELEKITNKDGFIRSFYEVLKIHTQFVIERIFITGVTSITLDSLTSGFNITENISNYPAMNGVVGFTFEEVNQLLDDTKLFAKDNILEVFKKNYNGYLFADDGERVYNSNMILYYLNLYQNLGKKPSSLADPNIVSDYRKISTMFDLYQDNVVKQQVLQSLMENESVKGDLVTSFHLSTNFSYDHFISLLYYLGLITIDKELESGGYQFRTPNEVIKSMYYDYYFTYLTKNFDITDSMIHNALTALEEENVEILIELVEKFIGGSTKNNNRYMIHFRENTLQTFFYLILRKSDIYNVQMEHKTDIGYIDMFCNPIQRGIPYIFEFKYLSDARYRDDNSLLESAIAEVSGQIEKDIKSVGICKAIAIIFVGKHCKYHKLRFGR